MAACNTRRVFAYITTFCIRTKSIWCNSTIPPLHVINEKLSKGNYDAGMGGGSEWKPLEITKKEYEELVEYLVTNPAHDIVEDKELWEKPNYKKWHGAMLSKYSKKIRGKS